MDDTVCVCHFQAFGHFDLCLKLEFNQWMEVILSYSFKLYFGRLVTSITTGERMLPAPKFLRFFKPLSIFQNYDRYHCKESRENSWNEFRVHLR